MSFRDTFSSFEQNLSERFDFVCWFLLSSFAFSTSIILIISE